MIQRCKAKKKKTWKEWLFSLTFSNDDFFILSVFSHFIFYSQLFFSVFHWEKKRRVLMPNSTIKIINFDINKFNLTKKVSLMCFLPLKLTKKQNQTSKRILFLVWICGYKQVSREFVLLVYLHHRNIFRCFGV